MEKSRLISVFDTLSKQELRELRKFVRSPYFNQQEILIRFLDYLAISKSEAQVTPTKAKVFQKLFPQQEFNDVKVRLLMSDLHKLIETFLICQNTFSNSVHNKIQLSRIYRQRNLPKHFQKTAKVANDLLEKNKLRHADYFDYRFEQLVEQYQFASANKRTDEYNLQEITNTLDVTFIIKKLKQTCLLFSHQAVYKKKYDLGLTPEVIEYVEQKGLLEIPAVAIYYYYYLSLTQEGHLNYFRQFKDLVFLHGNKFPLPELRDLYFFAINYCIRQLNQGKTQFIQECLDLYKGALEKGFLFDKQLSHITYNNIVRAALMVGDLTWATEFIENYKGSLKRRIRESTWKFNLARLEYEKKNYDNALVHLQKADFGDILNNLNAKTLSLKIYYELDEFNLLDSHLESMKTFIRRKTVMAYHQTNYLNIVRYTKKLLSTNFYDRAKKEALIKEIEQEEILTERDWLLEQIKKN